MFLYYHWIKNAMRKIAEHSRVLSYEATDCAYAVRNGSHRVHEVMKRDGSLWAPTISIASACTALTASAHRDKPIAVASCVCVYIFSRYLPPWSRCWRILLQFITVLLLFGKSRFSVLLAHFIDYASLCIRWRHCIALLLKLSLQRPSAVAHGAKTGFVKVYVVGGIAAPAQLEPHAISEDNTILEQFIRWIARVLTIRVNKK